jgi:hypothetical protein
LKQRLVTRYCIHRHILILVHAIAALRQQLFLSWENDEGPTDAILDHPSTGDATVATLRAEDGIRALNISHVAHPDLHFPTPSGKIELFSERAKGLGLPPLPVHEDLIAVRHPLGSARDRGPNRRELEANMFSVVHARNKPPKHPPIRAVFALREH